MWIARRHGVRQLSLWFNYLLPWGKFSSSSQKPLVSPGFFQQRVTSWVKSKFPNTPQITTQQLEDKLESCDSPILVIDCRSSQEHLVSHIRGSKHLSFNADEDVLNDFLVENGVESGRDITMDQKWADKFTVLLTRIISTLDTNIVCYCSVGYRSSILANKINALGACSASNLEGSMFKWANEGRSIIDFDGNTTHFVHPYNWFFGLATSPSKWLYKPRSQWIIKVIN